MKKLCIFVLNDVINDPRVQKEAETAADAGFEVSVVGTRSARSKPYEETGKYRITRLDKGGFCKFLGLLSRTCHFWKSKRSYSSEQALPSMKVKHLLLYRLASEIRSYLYLLDISFNMNKEAKKIKADLYHATDLPMLIPAFLASRKTGAKYLYDSHELYVGMNPERTKTYDFICGLIERLLIKRAGKVVTVNSMYAKELSRRYRIKKPEVVMNCPKYQRSPSLSKLDKERFKKSLNIPENSRIILYQGRYELGRGLEELIESAQYLIDATILLRGYGINETHLRLQVERSGFTDKVKFLRPVSMRELVASAAIADIGVIPYRNYSLGYYYASPNKLFEYMMAGLSLAVSNLPVMEKIVKETETGVCFNPDDPEDIARKLNRLIRDRTFLQKCRNNALFYAQKVYNWENEGKKLINLYHKILS